MTAHDYAASVLGHALAYAQRGIRVIPIMPGEKRPTMPAWQERATTDTATIMGWFGAHPDWGVGLATGRLSDLLVADIDVSGDKRGDDTLADLEATYGKLPTTAESITGSGGRHLLFHYPRDGDVFNDAGRRLGPGIDIRGEGGVIVAPPTIHPNGTPYMWEAMSSLLDGIALAHLPEWFLRLARGGMLSTAPREDRKPLIPRAGQESLPGDEFAAAVSWRELLMTDGATYLGTRVDHKSSQPYELWARPGVTDHSGATLYYSGSDVLKVFTSNWPGLEEGRTYTRFGYWAATRHGGNHSAAARAVREGQLDGLVGGRGLLAPAPAPNGSQGPTGAAQDQEAPAGEATELDALGQAVRSSLVDWSTFWQRAQEPEQWIAYPFIPAGRSIALYAPGKTGKSLFVLDVVASLVTGRPILGMTPAEACAVLYLDLEMGEVDLYDRMTDLGYGPEIDLGLLYYAALPALPPLDTAEGAAWVLKAIELTNAKLVVVDTLARAVKGDENEADTVRAFFRHTGTAIKRLGVAIARLDHMGKNAEKGQRGSSAKNDDVDAVFRLTPSGGNKYTLKRELSRVRWIPEVVHLERKIEPYVHHVITDLPNSDMPGGQKIAQIILSMDKLGIPLDMGMEAARKALTAAGMGAGANLVREAVKVRRKRADGMSTEEGGTVG